MSPLETITTKNAYRQVMPSREVIYRLNRSSFCSQPTTKDRSLWNQGLKELSPYIVPAPRGNDHKMRVWASLRLSDCQEAYTVMPWHSDRAQGHSEMDFLYFFRAKGGSFTLNDWFFTVVLKDRFKPYRVDSMLEAWLVDVLAYEKGMQSSLPDSLTLSPYEIPSEEGRSVLPMLPEYLGRSSPFKSTSNEGDSIVKPFSAELQSLRLSIRDGAIDPRHLKSTSVCDLEPSLLSKPSIPINELQLQIGQKEQAELLEVSIKLNDGRSFIQDVFQGTAGNWESVDYSSWAIGKVVMRPYFYAFQGLYNKRDGSLTFSYGEVNRRANLSQQFRDKTLASHDNRNLVIVGFENDGLCMWGWDRKTNRHQYLQSVIWHGDLNTGEGIRHIRRIGNNIYMCLKGKLPVEDIRHSSAALKLQPSYGLKKHVVVGFNRKMHCFSFPCDYEGEHVIAEPWIENKKLKGIKFRPKHSREEIIKVLKYELSIGKDGITCLYAFLVVIVSKGLIPFPPINSNSPYRLRLRPGRRGR